MSKVAIYTKLSSLAPIAFFAIGAFTSPVNAELKPMEDVELSEHVGQAMIAFDTTEGATAADPSTTRFTMGLDTSVQMNVDNVVLGEYADAATSTAADFQATNISLGHISRGTANTQLDGNTYAEGVIIPFEAVDPYFEMSESNGELVGFRLGFAKARGTISGDIGSFSGNIGLKIDDGTTVQDAKLLNSTGVATNRRATHIGLEDGSNFTELTNLKTLEIGQAEADGTVSFANDLFFSFQKQDVDWQSASGSTPITANAGVHVNIPTSMQLDLTQLQNGVQRVRTEYIDRGNGLF